MMSARRVDKVAWFMLGLTIIRAWASSSVVVSGLWLGVTGVGLGFWVQGLWV